MLWDWNFITQLRVCFGAMEAGYRDIYIDRDIAIEREKEKYNYLQ